MVEPLEQTLRQLENILINNLQIILMKLEILTYSHTQLEEITIF